MHRLRKFNTVCVIHLIYCGIFFCLFSYYFYFIKCICCFIVGFVVIFINVGILCFKITKKTFFGQKINSRGKAVFITGCDRGFGHFLTDRLLSKGYQVFASCLSPSTADVLKLQSKYSQQLHIFELDVTNDESVKRAYDFVKINLNKCELWAVVNNAGVLKGFHAEFSNIQDYKDSIEVNTLGIIRVTMAFLPLLKKSRGRIINVTSMSGRSAVITVSPYVTSKYAAVGFNDCLRHELSVWGIRVISIEPDYFRTKLLSPEGMEQDIDFMMTSLPSHVRDDYAENFFADFKNSRKAILRSASSKHHIVINDLEHAIGSVYPEDVYRPCGLLQSIPYIWLYDSMSPTFQNLFMKLCLIGATKPKG
ncbi:short-chain dehydrogenase/reductase family 9C member 7 [Parasteatoda tepidariorum]|uniref:short-chain dehydrogenase/reductase family 9C member 7 n=1 Tax=Parasteatoda tepidariorum TaxID=114398 RepID=UPI001C71A732|nr:short-chain dehydrogenase/reductase family 9C member 7 [Parasteatoda tepidariorum]